MKISLTGIGKGARRKGARRKIALGNRRQRTEAREKGARRKGVPGKNARANKGAPGSALVIALIVMAILLTISLGVSDLMLSTLRARRVLTSQMKAWYTAESAVEQALSEALKNPPGFEVERGGLIGESDLRYNYKITSKAMEIPAKELYEIKSKEDAFALLPLNESIVIPLFQAGPEGAPRVGGGEGGLASGSLGDGRAGGRHVKGFRVEYFIPPFLQGNTAALSENLDILRWKIFGISKKDGVTDVLNEFSPMQPLKNSADNPSCMGTDADCWNGVDIFYERVPTRDGGTEIRPLKDYFIETFLDTHRNNFLVLTNVVNVDLIAGSLTLEQRRKIANIRYKVGAPRNQNEKPTFTLPYIQIRADGESGAAKQSIDISLKRETFLPVFGYALYRTKN